MSSTQTKWGPVSGIARTVAIGALAVLIGSKLISNCHAECWDFHVHTEADDRRTEYDRESKERDDVKNLNEKESRGEPLNQSERDTRDSWEMRNMS